MAQRYGGRYSPENSRPDGTPPPTNPFQGARPRLAGGRVNALFLAALVFALRAFWRPPAGLAIDLLACALLLLAAWLTREGLLAEEAYLGRTVARRPALPRKILGALATGLGLAFGGYHPAGGLVDAAIFALLGTGLHLAAFGIDPLRDKGLAGRDAAATDRVATAVEGAESYLTAMQEAIRRAGDRGLSDHVARFTATARAMFRTIEGDPGDLTAARRYLGVYLMGARDATVSFADLYAQHRDPAARASYEALLSDLEANFKAQTQALLSNDKTKLDIQIDVLRERLSQEGVRPG